MGFFSKVGGILNSVGNFASGNFVGGVLGLGSTLLSNHSAKGEAQMARDEASFNRDWQERMSNTEVQRRVEDLKKAGLNPLLAVGGASSGASTPSGSVSGAQANISRLDPSFIQAMTNVYTAKKNGEVADAQKRNIDADTRNKDADTISKENYNSMHELRVEHARLKNELYKQDILNSKLDAEIKKAQTDEIAERILSERFRRVGIVLDNEQVRVYTQILRHEEKLAKAEANALENTTGAKNYMFFREEAGRFVDTSLNVVRTIADMIPGVDITTSSSSYDSKTNTRNTIVKRERR